MEALKIKWVNTKKVVRALTRKQPELNVVIISIWLLHKILQVGIKHRIIR